MCFQENLHGSETAGQRREATTDSTAAGSPELSRILQGALECEPHCMELVPASQAPSAADAGSEVMPSCLQFAQVWSLLQHKGSVLYKVS